MKQKIITAVLIIAALSLSMATSAKGPPARAVQLKDANEVTIGRVIGMETIGWPYVLTDEGYRTFFRMGMGMVTLFPDDGVFFASTGCMGMAYVRRGMFVGAVFLPTPDHNGFYGGGGTLLYIPNNAQRETVNIKSKLRSDSVCQDYGDDGLDTELYSAYLNDPYVTGIENTVYPYTMLIE